MIYRSDIIAFSFIVLFVIIFGIYLAVQPGPSDVPDRYTGDNIDRSGTFTHDGVTWQRFTDPETGLRVAYPLGGDPYTVVQGERATSSGHVTALHLYNKQDYIEFQNATTAREAPPSISVDVYERGTSTPLRLWIRRNAQRTQYQEQSELSTTTMSGRAGVSYRWDGLYQQQTVATADTQYVYLVSVGYISPDDRIRSVFDGVVDTLRLPNVTPQ